MTPYYIDESVTLYHGDCRKLMPEIGWADAIVTDPPYGETNLRWDRWQTGWPAIATHVTDSMWCFGSMRMFTERWAEFAAWSFSQDVVWEKHNGSSLAADRFRRVHEHALHFYRGAWGDMYREVPTTADATARSVRKKARPAQWHGATGSTTYTSEDGGPRLMRSVIKCRSMHGRSSHPTEKPVGILDPLIRYAVPPGGVVLDPFAGSGSTLDAARAAGRKAIGVEVDERYCEIAAQRLAQGVLTA